MGPFGSLLTFLAVAAAGGGMLRSLKAHQSVMVMVNGQWSMVNGQ